MIVSVAYGRWSEIEKEGAEGLPGRRSFSRRRRRFGRCASSASPRRSSFGARLRSRAPQYGHSVTYGLTSEPQFLQMTLSSVSLMTIRGYPATGLPMADSAAILARHPYSRRNHSGVEEPDRAEIAARDASPRQTRPPVPPSLRVRPGQRHADAVADRPGHRARPAGLLPQPGFQGPRLPVPACRRGRLFGPGLPDRHGGEVLPGLR